MSYQGFVWKNGMRNKRRAILTIISVALTLFVLSNLATFVSELDRGLETANPLRLVTRHAVSLTTFLPARHRQQIEKIPGVVRVTPLTYFGGVYIDRAHTDFAQFSCDPQALFDIYQEFKIPEEQKQAFLRERAAAIVGRQKAEKHGWKLGDRVTLTSSIFRVDLELTIRGIFSNAVSGAAGEGSVFFHHAYLEEVLGRPGFAGFYAIRADAAESVPRIIKAIDATFRNTNAPTKTETEQSFRMGFFSMLGNLKVLIATISSVILFTLLLVTANTMAMSVRERIREVAILKSLGFRRWQVLALLASEGATMTLAGGLIGCTAARLLSKFVDMPALTQGFLQEFSVPWGITALGLVASVLVGLIATAVPAYRAASVTVADGLRHVG
jgi:putative ABC transport system permease protein